MLQLLYRASFFLYEISFILFALALGSYSESLRKITRAWRLGPYWLCPVCASLLMLLCALMHFYVYHFLSPRYLQTGAHEQLLLMYLLKTISMLSIFLAGACLLLGNGMFLKKNSA